MRTFLATLFMASIVLVSNHSLAAHHGKASIGDKTISTIKDNPGTSMGVAACGVAIAFFPPAALVCGGAIAAGATVDQTSN
jgi:hypothetical protein